MDEYIKARVRGVMSWEIHEPAIISEYDFLRLWMKDGENWEVAERMFKECQLYHTSDCNKCSFKFVCYTN